MDGSFGRRIEPREFQGPAPEGHPKVRRRMRSRRPAGADEKRLQTLALDRCCHEGPVVLRWCALRSLRAARERFRKTMLLQKSSHFGPSTSGPPPVVLN